MSPEAFTSLYNTPGVYDSYESRNLVRAFPVIKPPFGDANKSTGEPPEFSAAIDTDPFCCTGKGELALIGIAELALIGIAELALMGSGGQLSAGTMLCDLSAITGPALSH
jgi:hypothetical protein